MPITWDILHGIWIITVGTCWRCGFRRAFLSEGHGTAKRESSERHRTNQDM